ncbi:MAG: hypothetical protein KC535_03695 [Nanoarchaeota archaeon]|nr:hypothetical protein [Nanoarchaeota archaeon]
MKYEKALRHIAQYWNELLVFSPEDKGIHIGLPHHFIKPNADAFNDDQFYWDTFFISVGLLTDDTHLELVKGMIDNFRYLQQRFDIIPARNKFYNLGISQPPFLSTLVRLVHEKTHDLVWLTEQLPVLERELKDYWMGTGVSAHLLESGLSRYCDHNITHQTAEHESGWDMTSRFDRRCLDFTPIDLNSCLYKYEMDLSFFYHTLGRVKKATEYEQKALFRKEQINTQCWNEEEGFFFDYDHIHQEKGTRFSLAGFFPLWAGLASEEQAHRMVDHLTRFEYEGGLVTTDEQDLDPFTQWDYPNGWPNLQWIVIKGLKRYHFLDDAKRIAGKWLELNNQLFEETGAFWEKYDVVDLAIGKSGRYPTQKGFGWTNGVFVALYKEFFE